MFFRNDDKKDPKSKSGVRTVPLLPLRDIIVFPHMVVPLFVGREKSIAALEEAMSHDKDILLAAQKKAKTNEPAPDDIFEIGTLGTILQLLRLPDGTVKVLVEGKKRARIRRYAAHEKFFLVEAEEVDEISERDEFKSELQELEEKIKNKKMSKEAIAKAKKELRKLKMMSPMSAEATVVRNYIDWIITLPWYEYTKDKLDINEAEKILNDDHYGLKKPKERILEYLAVQAMVDRKSTRLNSSHVAISYAVF